MPESGPIAIYMTAEVDFGCVRPHRSLGRGVADGGARTRGTPSLRRAGRRGRGGEEARSRP
eukprot:scaffold83592_cov31-Tisochrysis_lutea.AAC.2